MNRSMTYAMIITVLCGFAIILAINMAALFGFIGPKYISKNVIRGVAVEHDGHLYTLNFQQQTQLLDLFNNSKVIVPSSFTARKVTPENAPSITKIIIYRLDQPDIDITPIGYVSNKNSKLASFVYSAPAWAESSYLEESNPGEALKLLKTTYDNK